MHKRVLTKPDGRLLQLYSNQPIPDGLQAPSPQSEPVVARPHLRWHPLRGEWVAYASHRQNRTFLPPPEWNPLAPMVNKDIPTEVPQGPWEVAVFDNLFPSLAPHAPEPPADEKLYVETKAGIGACEVVVFSQDPKGSLGGLPLDRIELLLKVWAERTREIGARPEIQYVMPFENRGVEMGVTLHHPHGQIYAYSFIPPIPARELEMQKEYFEKNKRSLMENVIADELEDGRRVIYDGPEAIAFLPAFARYPYEVWVAPKKHAATLAELRPEQIPDLARALKTTLLKFDGMWKRVFPYLMTVHQGPTDGKAHPEAHVHFQFYPPYRTQDKLKYLAGTELGSGMFASDSLPEQKAADLRAVEVKL